jgi:hypothetical protein
MTLDTPISNVLIEGNTFDYGNFSTTPTGTPTTFGYGNCIWTNADVRVQENYFSAAVAAVTTQVVAFGGSCFIANNTFIRGTTTIVSYIDVSGETSDSIIVDNVFDSPTVDGYNQTLTVISANPSVLTIYERNKNQTAIKQVQKSSYLMESAIVPTINASERASYISDATTIYNSNGYYTTDLTFSFKHQGVAMNYTTPFAHSSGIYLSGPFTVTNGSTSVSPLANNPVVLTNVSGSITGYMLFGNDNAYYSVTIATLSNNTINNITLGSSYIGTSAIITSAIFFPTAAPLSTPLQGMFSVMGSPASPNVTAGFTQSNVLVAGSKIEFNDNTGNIYTVQSINSAGTSIVLTTNYIGSNSSTITATGNTVYGSFDFSINLSEVLPENVQVISTLFGVYGNNNVSSLVTANYNAVITTDSGIGYSSILLGTFSVINGSPNVTATVSQTGFIGVGSSICFSSQSDVVYPVLSVSGTSVTLAIPFTGTTTSGLTAVYFDGSLADAVHNTIVNATTVGFGANIGLVIGTGSGQVPPTTFSSYSQYLKIDPPAFGFIANTGSKLIRYNFNITITMLAGSQAPGSLPTGLFFPESPLIVQYRW